MEFQKMVKIFKYLNLVFSIIIIIYLTISFILDNFIYFRERCCYIEFVWGSIGIIFLLLLINLVLSIIFFKKINKPILTIILTIINIIIIFFIGDSFNPH